MSDTVVTCVYCGHEYPDGTPTAKAELLTAHIKTCHKHPMRQAEADVKTLWDALAEVVGATDRKELQQMREFISTAKTMGIDPASCNDTAIAAIDALLAVKDRVVR